MSAKLAESYYARNRDRSLAQAKAYREAHREEILAREKEYRRLNKEKIAADRERRKKETPEQAQARRAAAKIASARKKLAAQRRRRLVDPAPTMFRSTRYRAGKLQIPFALTLEDVRGLYAEGQCECCGSFVGAENREVMGLPATYAATLDRVVPSLGYVPGNIALLCWACNRAKGNSTLNQLEQLAAWLRKRLSP